MWLADSPLCVQWFTNPQTSAMVPTCNTVISSAVKVNTMNKNNICNDKYWGITHQVLTAAARTCVIIDTRTLEGGSETDSSESDSDCCTVAAARCWRSLAFPSRALRTARALGPSKGVFWLWLRILTVDGGALPSAKFSQFISTCVSFCVQQHGVYDYFFFKIFPSIISMWNLLVSKY